MKNEARIIHIKMIVGGAIAEAKIHGGSKSKAGCCFDMLPLPMLRIIQKKVNKSIKVKIEKKK